MKCPCVYILASQPNGTLYTGVTSNLPKRMYEHTDGVIKGFSDKYGTKTLVYYEIHNTMLAAIKREKQVKEWKRLWKIRLIESMNPEWLNLYDRQTGAIAYGSADHEARHRLDPDDQ